MAVIAHSTRTPPRPTRPALPRPAAPRLHTHTHVRTRATTAATKTEKALARVVDGDAALREVLRAPGFAHGVPNVPLLGAYALVLGALLLLLAALLQLAQLLAGSAGDKGLC